MNKQTGVTKVLLYLVAMIAGLIWAPAAMAITAVPVGTGIQCPNDIDNMPINWSLPGGVRGAEDLDWNNDGVFDIVNPNAVCKRIGATDGFVQMPDGTNHYSFGFVDLTGIPENLIVEKRFHAMMPAPTITVDEGKELFLTLTNLSLVVRPDLADPHTIHFHGYPHTMAIFDGVPELSITVPGGSNFTYYYKLNDAGTYPYHCHVEPTEHIEMGMVGFIIVNPIQNGDDTVPGGPVDLLQGNYAYNDGGLAPDTSYDTSINLEVHDLDPLPHLNLETVQEGTTEWYRYRPQYSTFNGRAYPDTLLPNDAVEMTNKAGQYNVDYIAQPDSSLIVATAGERILLRLNNLSYSSHTLVSAGIPMHVVGEDARWLRSPSGVDLSYMASTYVLTPGKTADVILDTTGLTPGTYFLYGRELFSQSGVSLADKQESDETGVKVGADIRSGAITEIWIQ